MNLIERIKARRDGKREDREAIAKVREEQLRAGDEPPTSIAETIEDVAGQFPPSA